MIPPEKAADMALEVVALRAENEALRLEVGDWINDQADKVARLADAEAEIARLRRHLPSDEFLSLLERSSLGSADVRAASERVSRDAAAALVRWADEMQAREAADDALRTLRERVAGLADEFIAERHPLNCIRWCERCDQPDDECEARSFKVVALRAALADAPAEATPPAEQRAEGGA